MNNISIKRKLINFFSDLLIGLFRLNRPNKLLSIFLERIKPTGFLRTTAGVVKFNCSNELLWWRVDSFQEKEPDTIQWIENMQAGEVFCDIGANIGLYSMFAAKKGLKVISFEPEALNYAELCRNIALNQFHQVSPFNIAVSDKTGLISFKISNPYAGAANHQVEQLNGFSAKQEPKQTVQGESFDNLVSRYGLPCPTHIKIDVDGLEYEIIKGLKETLQNTTLKSILIEIEENLAHSNEIVKEIISAGFILKNKTDYPYKINNYIFARPKP